MFDDAEERQKPHNLDKAEISCTSTNLPSNPPVSHNQRSPRFNHLHDNSNTGSEMNQNDPNDGLLAGNPIANTTYPLPHTNLAPLPPSSSVVDGNATIKATSTIKNSNKRPLPARPTKTTKQNGEPLSEKKLRRLEKNRLSARECRRRKREATENLQRQINVLEGENLRLRLQLQIGEEAEASNQEEQKKMMQSLDSLLKSGASESEIYASIEEYKEKFADYGRDRRSAIEFHLRNVERLLMPTQTTNVLVKTLQMSNHVHDMSAKENKSTGGTNTGNALEVTKEGSPQFHPGCGHAEQSDSTQREPPTTPPQVTATQQLLPFSDMKSLFNHLVELLEVTPDQAAALKDSRFVAQEMDECLKNSLNVLGELQTRLLQCGDSLETEFNTIRTILTPTQAAKFLVWVAQNPACMHMLNELWDRVYLQPTDDSNGNVVKSTTSTTDRSTSNVGAESGTTGSAIASSR